MSVSEEGTSFKKFELEAKILKYFQNKEISKERNEENKLIFEEIEQIYEEIGGEDEIVIELPNGELAVLTPDFFEKEVLDKEGLADEIMVPKDELKTPFDFCILTSQGKLTPAMVTKHTLVDRGIKLKLKKQKRKSKRGKKK